jgi:hypothetical protein
MANAVYPSGLASFAGALIDWDTDDIKVALLDGYTYSSSDSLLSDLSFAIVGTPTTLATRSIVGGDLLSSPVSVISVPSGHTITSYVIFKDTGTPSTSPLVCYVDTNSDTTPISVVTDGNNIAVDWSSVVVTDRVLKI